MFKMIGACVLLLAMSFTTSGQTTLTPPVTVTPGGGGLTTDTLAITDGSTPAAHNGSVVLSFSSRTTMQAYQPTYVGTNMVIATIAGYNTPGNGGAATG